MFDANRVAIIIPLYKDAAQIGRAIDSACASQLPEGFSLDVIVVDDCSPDDSFEAAQTAAKGHANVQVLRTDRNGGPSAARNLGLSRTTALWFTPLDSDDIVAPSRLLTLLQHALNRNLDMVADNLIVTDADQPIRESRSLWPGKPPGVVRLTAELFVRNSVNMPEPRTELGFLKPLIRRTAAGARAKEPYTNEIRFGEDYELYTHLLFNGARAELLDPAGYYFVQRAGSASRTAKADHHLRLAAVDRALLRRPDLSLEARRALKAHLDYSVREWARWQFIQADRPRTPGPILSAFLHQPFISSRLLWSALFRRLKSLFSQGRTSDARPGPDHYPNRGN